MKYSFACSRNEFCITGSNDQEIKKRGDKELKTLNFVLRCNVEKLSQENRFLKRRFSNQKEDLAGLKAEKCRLETETEKKRKLVVDQDKQINALKGMFVGVRRKHDHLEKKLTENNQNFEEAKKEIRQLKRKVSFTAELENEVRQKKIKLEEKSVTIERLQKNLNSERDKFRVQNGELVIFRKNLEQVSIQLQNEREEASKSKNEIKVCHSLISEKLQNDELQKDEIQSLKNQVQNLSDNSVRQKAACDQKDEYIKILESQGVTFCRVVEESKNLQKQCDNATLKIARLENELKEVSEQRAHLQQIIDQHEILKIKTKETNTTDEIRFKDVVGNQNELGILTGEHENMVTFIEEDKVSFDVEENNQFKFEVCAETGILNSQQLEMLPSAVINSDTSNTPHSNLIVDYLLPHSPPPPIIIESRTIQCGGDELYNELISNVITTLPPSRKRKPIKQVHKRHGEDIERRLQETGVERCGGGYYCFCGTLFDSEYSLATHIQQHVTPPERKFQCYACPKKFIRLGHLKRHMKDTHCMPDALKQFVCGCRFCGSLFETRQKYNQHCCSFGKHTSQVQVNICSSSTHVPIPSCTVTVSPTVHIFETMETEERKFNDPEHTDMSDNSVSTACALTGNNDEYDLFRTASPNKNSDSTHCTNLTYFMNRHGVNTSGENLCLCGVSFANLEILKTHIEMRSGN